MSTVSPAWPRSPTSRPAWRAAASGTRTFLFALAVMLAVTAASAGLTAWASRALVLVGEAPAAAERREPGRTLAASRGMDSRAAPPLAAE